MTKILSKELAFNGRLRTAVDGASIGPNDFQVLKNLRYTDANVKPVSGMSKINTSALASTGIRNGFHFRKSLPAESHILAWTDDGKVWVNNTAVPSQGAFEASALFTDTPGGTTGRFAPTPGGALAYANGVEACLWGGTEHRCAGFMDYPTTGQIYDYGDLITNSKTDDQNVATIHTAQATIDANTMLLLHCDGVDTGTIFTDSSLAPKTVSAYTGAITSTTKFKFGSAAGYFQGTGYLSTPAIADLDLSSGIWTIEGWFYPTYFSGTRTIYYQETNASNYFNLEFASLGLGPIRANTSGVALSIVSGGVEVVELHTGNGTVPINQWSHVAVVQNGTSYYMFVNGSLVASTTDADSPDNYTGNAMVGSNGSAYYYGYIDEFRVSNSARWITNFSPPSVEYGPLYISTSYIGSIMPLDGGKFTVGTPNTMAATMSMSEWNGSGWASLSIADNTSSGGVSLAQTGTVTWASTASTSKPTAVEKVYLYWYKMVITGSLDFGGVTLSQVTVSIPFQAVKDIWDGEERPCNSFVVYDSPKYLDYTSNVLENEFSSTGAEIDKSTYAKLVSLTTTDYLYAGFIERMAGVTLYIIDEYGNANSVLLSWDYWNGSAWTPLTATDGTLDGSKSLAKSGWVTWPPADRASEFKKDISSGKASAAVPTPVDPGDWSFDAALARMRTYTANKTGAPMKSTGPLYYYRASFSGAISSDVRIYHVAGIPAPKDIRGYSFPMLHQNRPVLVCNTDGAKNTILIGASATSNVYNGLDSYEFSFGQEEAFNAGASLFLRFGSSVQDMLMLTKQGEIHLLEGNGSDADEYRTRLLSATIGCRAPLTMTTVPVGDLGGGVRRQIVVWESQRGIELFDGASLMDPLLSHDINDKFDPSNANYAGSSTNAGFYDATLDEYHWIVPGSQEWVYSFKYKKWFQIDRSSGVA